MFGILKCEWETLMWQKWSTMNRRVIDQVLLAKLWKEHTIHIRCTSNSIVFAAAACDIPSATHILIQKAD